MPEHEQRRNGSTHAAAAGPGGNGAPAANGVHPKPIPLLPLTDAHRKQLHDSGLTDGTIDAHGFASLKLSGHVRLLLGWKRMGVDFGSCLVIPFRRPDGSPVPVEEFCRLRPDRPRKVKGKTAKYESPKGKPLRAYFPLGTIPALADPSRPLTVTEGEKKACAADQHGFPCVALCGVDAWSMARPKKNGKAHGPRELLPELAGIPWKGRRVYIAYDSDLAEKAEVRRAERQLAQKLQGLGADVRLVRIPPGPPGPDGKPGKVGLDDLLKIHGPGAFAELLEKAEPPNAEGRPEVLLGFAEDEVVDGVVELLARDDPDLYQRGGLLVRVVKDPLPAQVKRLKLSGGLRVEQLPSPSLRLRLTRVADFVTTHETQEGTVYQPARPPQWLVEGIACLGRWEGVRHLEAVVESPVLRPDGTLLEAPGYDPETALLYQPFTEYPPCPPSPTRDDARHAAELLGEAVCDFPFASATSRSGWLAAALTPLARFAFDGPAPLFLFDANVRGAGKGLLADLVACVVSGRDFARAPYSRDDEEMRKSIGSLALAGERLVLLDNLAGLFGGPNLDAALTSTEWQGRILGKSQQPRVPLLMTWYATGNNVAVMADTARRVCHIRIESPEERPEDRSGFRHPDLLAWAKRERGRLLVAALTMLAAYCRAGRPDQGLRPWGSYEGWSALVRGAIVWAGLPDPGDARMTMTDGVDRDVAALRGLLAGWAELDPDNEGLTVAQALALLDAQENKDRYAVMRQVVAELFDLAPGKTPTAKKLAYRIRQYVGRSCGGKCFYGEPGHGGVMRWRVRDMAAGPRAGCNPGGGFGGFGGFDPDPFKVDPGATPPPNYDPGANPEVGANKATKATKPTSEGAPDEVVFQEGYL